ADKQADSTASDVAGVVKDFNALIAKLKAAGIMSS
ncbi:head fiber protein, partial [Bacillus paranthracis]|nr:head fiber protein [Bacillus paranthracis]